MAKYSSVLFDLDGNLLPMDMDNFIKIYFGSLAKYMVPYGYEPESFIAAVWAGTKAMIKNDGTMANENRFWSTFASQLGEEILNYKDEISDEINRIENLEEYNQKLKQNLKKAK